MGSGGIKEIIISVVIFLVKIFIVNPLDAILDYLQWYFSGNKPNPFLSGNFAPVQEEFTTFKLPITKGSIPAELAGEFVRNGPNPRLIPKGGYHWFDGDGMLHGVRISPDGSVGYINRYIQTQQLKEEKRLGRRLKPRIGELYGKIGIVKVLFHFLKFRFGITHKLGSTANTALVFHNKKLQATLEADVPYEIRVLRDGTFETAARLNYGGKLSVMTAHPKVDPVTNELFYFAYSIQAKPYLKYGLIDNKGTFIREMPVDIPDPIMMHDFAITEHYAIFLDFALVQHKEEMSKGGYPFRFDREHKSRIGVLDRYAKDSTGTVWFQVDPSFSFHTANAWEEGDWVVLNVCIAKDFNLNEPDSSTLFEMVEFRCNMKTKAIEQTTLFPGLFVEFPRVHPDLIGRKSRYIFGATHIKDGSHVLQFNGIVKLDIQEMKSTVVPYGKKRYGGEPVYVPRKDAKSEDDGYLMTFVHDETTDKSEFKVIDGLSMTDVATVILPQRVPYGFHGIFMSEQELASQAKFK